MSLNTNSSRLTTQAVEQDLVLVRSFLAEQGEALGNAAELLGGAERGRRCLSLLDLVSSAISMSTQCRTALVEMHELLVSGLADLQKAKQGVHYTTIDPSDQILYELQLLIDRLEGLLEEIGSGACRRCDE